MSIDPERPTEAQESQRDRAIVHAIESALLVNRRYQFFVWTQGSLQVLLPHEIAVLGIYERSSKKVSLEALNSIVVPDPVLALLTDGRSAFMQQIFNAWIINRCRPLVVSLDALSAHSTKAACDALRTAAITEFLVHGVSRPQRASEIETLFMFATPGACISASQVECIDLLVPHLHSTLLRVHATELQLRHMRAALPAVSSAAFSNAAISHREAEVLSWAREGMSNQEIGSKLKISPLTVKNHIQKILRKLGAANRAQAVARAMSMNLLERSSDDGAVATEEEGKFHAPDEVMNGKPRTASQKSR